MTQREFLSLDFYGQGVSAALAVLDEKTDTLRIRHVLRQPCKAFCGAFVRDMSGAQDALGKIFAQMDQFVQASPSVIVGVRGSFLSFQNRSGMAYVESRNHVIRESDIDNSIKAALPEQLDESLEIIDVLPLSYSIDDQPGASYPKGRRGWALGVEAFVSYAVGTHLANLNTVLSNSGCEQYQVLPSVIAQGETLLLPNEKNASCLLVDIGETGTSALLYHKDALVDAWEIPFGLDRVADKMADLLQNDLPTAWQVLHTYEPDPVTDDLLEDAALPTVKDLHKEFVQSLEYIKHPPTHVVLCGQMANQVLLKLLKNTLATRKARLGAFEHLIADCNTDAPLYSGVLALLEHALAREKSELGVAQVKEPGFLDNLLTKFGLNSIF